MKNYLLLFSFLCFLFSSCDDEKHSSVPGCCDNDPVQEQVGVGKFWLPNVFTPNADGINDNFFVLGDTGIQEVLSFKIFSKTGDLVYNVIHAPLGYSGWGGTIEGTVQTDLFTYRVEVQSIDGITKVVQGEVCSFPCDPTTEKEPKFDAILNCKFGRQNNGGVFDVALPAGEQWDCLEQ